MVAKTARLAWEIQHFLCARAHLGVKIWGRKPKCTCVHAFHRDAYSTHRYKTVVGKNSALAFSNMYHYQLSAVSHVLRVGISVAPIHALCYAKIVRAPCKICKQSVKLVNIRSSVYMDGMACFQTRTWIIVGGLQALLSVFEKGMRCLESVLIEFGRTVRHQVWFELLRDRESCGESLRLC